MKYMLLFTRGGWQENGTEDEVADVYAQLGPWFAKLRAEGTYVEGARLEAPGSATTVVIEEGRSLLVDRPLMEAKEAVGGYGIVEVADLDEALSIARTFPVPDGKIEVRPVAQS
jgi:hypothetical protein